MKAISSISKYLGIAFRVTFVVCVIIFYPVFIAAIAIQDYMLAK